MTLDTLKPGQRARITALDTSALSPEEARRLLALGLGQGARVAIAHKGVFGGSDPIAVIVGRMTVAVRRAHARAMSIEPVSHEADEAA
ncbi:FeoA family protein [Pseudoblastomonas halimionae]|uniref:Ferrous iron transport protein A n=1 Tax=Alteriqipengyuania halimionae TaxID=1926630 RepID=A0A6I4U7L1_9SPHN|nr:FeoA family protein [Alteriqipengyuania halimionae]MXP10371.1 ferrous iron transport protein A [Alteriqipengyuania halimionae]